MCLPEEMTYEVVVHGISVDDDLSSFQNWNMTCLRGSQFIKVERLKQKSSSLHNSKALSFAGSYPDIVCIWEEGQLINNKTELC